VGANANGDDDSSALSFVTVSPVAASNSVRLDGKAFDLNDRWFASWSAEANLELTPTPVIHYRWTGLFEGQEGAKIAGQGYIKLDQPATGPFFGSYSDIRLAEIRNGLAPTREKRFSFVRLTDDELADMQNPLSDYARRRVAQVRKRLAWE
jgi:hypothetical protein